MKVFISWSGERSKKVAQALSTWIKQLIQATDPWISPDIEKGARWSDDLGSRLDESRYGIVCLTVENLSSEWILFESGALSKTKDARVCTFLLDLAPADVKPPLGQFQATVFDKEDIRKLVHGINTKVKEQKLNNLQDTALDELFETLWPRLELKLLDIRKESVKKEVVRPDREILEEILGIVRAQEPVRMHSNLWDDEPIDFLAPSHSFQDWFARRYRKNQRGKLTFRIENPNDFDATVENSPLKETKDEGSEAKEKLE